MITKNRVYTTQSNIQNCPMMLGMITKNRAYTTTQEKTNIRFKLGMITKNRVYTTPNLAQSPIHIVGDDNKKPGIHNQNDKCFFNRAVGDDNKKPGIHNC